MFLNSGLEEVHVVRVDENRQRIMVGKARILDLVGSGPDMIAEYKVSKHDPAQADPRSLLQALTRLLTGSDRCVG